MKKQAISLMTLSILLICSGSEAKTDINTDSDALFANIAVEKSESIDCNGASDSKPCIEQVSKSSTRGRDLFGKEEPVWLDEIEECTWSETEDYAEMYDDLPEHEAVSLNRQIKVAEQHHSQEKNENVDMSSATSLKIKQAMATIASKPIPREVHKPKSVSSKAKNKPKNPPKNNIAKIKPKKQSSKKKTATTVAKKTDENRTTQRAVTYTVRGKSYTTVADSRGFVQKGTASWYGKRFHGLTTASGEPFDMHAMTAAHKKLPLGTKIEVVNNENGKKVIVTVNDRGPFYGDRVLDLSKAAAKELGAVEQGTVDVTIRALQ